MTIKILKYQPGTYRSLRKKEVELCQKLGDSYADYCFVVTASYYVKLKRENGETKEIFVPERMLSDGATGVSELGTSYLIHDFLYACPYFFDGTECDRMEADAIMVALSRMENFGLFADALSAFSYVNPLGLFSRAHDSSSCRGVSFLPDYELLY